MNQLTVVAGPTAVGKGTVLRLLAQQHPEIYFSVSATTRDPRPGEVDGQHYHFVTEAEFDELVASNQMLEWAVVHGKHRYGTMRAPIMEALAAGKPAIVEIDLAGARQIRESMPEAKHVFIAPPTFEDLAKRLATRGTESDEERERRLATAKVELAAQAEFDRVIVNDTVENCALALASFMGLD
ncbi:guanylate kinase [Boudabousia tangfeifanii]|uniref:Guanylate kinase n=1 Tax=Boudabousia tangfeifanii TaxID=1912795 RepID=A0A1D9MJZ7_9ACTO|nr:guanylate kinase [Boudabousia tangfeifanii]AOZ72625.1 guanylate kinase [Boudabousia tangfeifanii]